MHSATKKIKSMIVLLLVLFFVLTFSKGFTAKAEAQTIVVPDDFLSVFDAVEAASEGDTIHVKSGTYDGPINQTLIINKTISVIGENPKTTTLFLHPEWITKIIITANLSHYAEPISIGASDVKISGLTINGDGGEIGANGDRTIITGNIFGFSVALRGSHQLFTGNTLIGAVVHCRGTYASVSKNTIYNGSIGSDSGSYDKIFANNVTGSISIVGTSNHELVYNNTIKDSSGAGISIAGIATTVVNNTVSNCSTGITHHVGSSNNVRGNVITNNRGPALKVEEGSNFTFVQNYVADNPVGVQIDGTIFLLYQNSFVNNNVQVEILDDRIYFWSLDNGKIGNYWSDYTGEDADGDGIGDPPYIIGKQIQDNYPLMEPAIIPEFPSWTPLLIILVAVVAVAVVYRHRLHKSWRRLDAI
jgi:hypothetical protein